MAENNRILFINDDEAVSNYLKKELAMKAGYAVSSESNVRAGLEIFKQNSFDIVIVKFGMPDLNGTEIVRRLKKIDPIALSLPC